MRAQLNVKGAYVSITGGRDVCHSAGTLKEPSIILGFTFKRLASGQKYLYQVTEIHFVLGILMRAGKHELFNFDF